MENLEKYEKEINYLAKQMEECFSLFSKIAKSMKNNLEKITEIKNQVNTKKDNEIEN